MCKVAGLPRNRWLASVGIRNQLDHAPVFLRCAPEGAMQRTNHAMQSPHFRI